MSCKTHLLLVWITQPAAKFHYCDLLWFIQVSGLKLDLALQLHNVWQTPDWLFSMTVTRAWALYIKSSCDGFDHPQQHHQNHFLQYGNHIYKNKYIVLFYQPGGGLGFKHSAWGWGGTFTVKSEIVTWLTFPRVRKQILIVCRRLFISLTEIRRQTQIFCNPDSSLGLGREMLSLQQKQ